MRTGLGLSAAALATTFMWLAPRPAEGLRAHMGQVPNGPRYGCVLCHTSTIDVAFNLFGQDVRSTLRDGRPDWSALAGLDSDADGQTNGQELGDPCAVWRPGLVPGRYSELSAPGDPSSTSATPGDPPCETLDAGYADVGASDASASTDAAPGPDAGLTREAGGCDCDLAPTGGPESSRGLGLWVLALLLLRAPSARTQNRSGQSS